MNVKNNTVILGFAENICIVYVMVILLCSLQDITKTIISNSYPLEVFKNNHVHGDRIH